MGWINTILTSANDFLYTNILIILLIAAGLFFTFRTKFAQFTLLPDGFRSLKEKSDGKKVSSFQALMLSTASRVGTANIAGVTSAIVTGGPGAVLWMWIIALIGSASAFVESTLAQIYKTKDGDNFRGGPSYYIQKALGKKWLGSLFAIILVVCFSFGFNPLQAHNLSSSLSYYIPNYFNSIYPWILGLVLSVITALIIFGGLNRISHIVSFIVPVMAIVYISMGLYIVAANLEKIPDMITLIFRSAFDFKAIFGGFTGSVLMLGIKRGLLSNEAGMGSGANAAATAHVDHPITQGIVQVISVFIDTMLICTTSAMIVLLSGVDLKCGLNEVPFVQAAVSNAIHPFAIHLITFSIIAFAFSSIIGNHYYAEANLGLLNNSKTAFFIFRVLALFAIFMGSIASAKTVWNLADLLMGIMAVVNIIVILLLHDVVKKALDDYKSQKKLGKTPVFKAEEVGIKNTDVWK